MKTVFFTFSVLLSLIHLIHGLQVCLMDFKTHLTSVYSVHHFEFSFENLENAIYLGKSIEPQFWRLVAFGDSETL